MSTFILEAQYFRYEIVCSQGPGTALLKFLADLVVLAEHTAKIASGKKDGPGTFCPRNGRFFSKMQIGMGNLDTGTDPAKASFSFKSVHPTFARATFTFCQLIC